jgi:hypothetical protein
MKNILLAVALATFVVLAGCGGAGGGSSSTGGGGDPTWAGRYTGTWKALAIGHNGTANVTVDASGSSVSGSVYDRQADETGALTGRLQGNGSFSGTVAFESGSYSLRGTFTKTSAGMNGTLTQSGGGSEFETTFTLTKQP